MEISFSTPFKKVFAKRIKNTISEIEFWNRVETFANDPFNSKLKTHKLSGKLKDLWSFSVEKNVRVVFYFTKDNPPKAVFVDIGTHDQVY